MSARIPASLTLLLLLLAGSALAKPVDKSFNESFDVAPGAILHLEHGDGDVTIEAWDRDSIEVDVRYFYDLKKWALGGEERDFEMKFDQRGEHVYVAEQITGGGHSFGIHARVRKEYSYTIKLPAYCVLELKGDDGSVQISGMKSALELSSDDGDVDLFECAFTMADLSMEDGDLRVKSCQGNFEVECDDSDLDFEDSEIASLRIETEDGDVDLDLAAVTGVDWHIISDDGDVSLDYSGEMSAELRIESDEGEMRVDIQGLQDVEKRRHSISGILGDGNGRIRIRTEDGDVRIRQFSTAG
jgi:hypothetical protein